MFTYEITTGCLTDADGSLVGVGYSGDPEHKNDASATWLSDQGPIPPGLYTIGAPVDTETHGPYVLSLTPDPANEMHGRSGFLMHGDSVSAPGTASKGCIIVPHGTRLDVWSSGDRSLKVIV